jgi:FkbM family methyltransferase
MELVEIEGFLCRNGTTDTNAVLALPQDDYRLWGQPWSGWMIDVGAHIGTIGLTLARQNPDLRVLCIEAVPDNADLLEANISRLGLASRVISIRAYAAAPGTISGTCHYGYRYRESESDGYVSAHRYVGNTWIHLGEPEHSVEVPAVSLDRLLREYDIEDVALLKIDCEGCEWSFLDTPAIAKVQTIRGEYHGGYPGEPGHVFEPAKRIVEMLSATHDVEVWIEDPSVGTFTALRR